MRGVVAALVVLVGCGPDDRPVGAIPDAARIMPDADPCSDPGPNLGLLTGIQCKPGALSSVGLDGTWTFTGTFTNLRIGAEEPFSGEVQIERTKPDGCRLTVAFSETITGTVSMYLDDTSATFSWMTPPGVGHLMEGERILCVAADNSLTFEDAYESYFGGNPSAGRFHGVLTR